MNAYAVGQRIKDKSYSRSKRIDTGETGGFSQFQPYSYKCH